MNITTLIIATLAVLIISSSAYTSDAPFVRKLTDYKNDNGKRPSGLDGTADDTSAMRKALKAGPGVLYIGPGYYRLSKVTIPSGVTITGAGPATIVRSAGSGYIFEVNKVTDWAIRDIVLDGEAKGDWHGRKDTQSGGISVLGCGKYDIVGVTLRNFDGTGLCISHFDYAFLGGGGGNLERITAYGNHTGIRFDTRAEYSNAVSLSCFNNIVGCAIYAGNVKIAASNFGTNIDGLVIEDHENGSHGAISNCLMNHNERYALYCNKVQYGMAFNGCNFFYGTIRLENSMGVNIGDGIIGCSITTIGTNANRISGNYIIPDQTTTFDFAPSTIVTDNFTSTGLWDKNGKK